MSDKNSEKKEIEIKRITTPQGDVPTVDSVLEALNLIMNRISAVSRNFDERMKFSGASLEASEYIEQSLSESNQKINELKKNLRSNSEQIDDINNNVLKLDNVVLNLEKMTKQILNEDFKPQSKSYEEIIEIKKMTLVLKDNVNELQKNLGEGHIELSKLYWEYNYADIKEDIEELLAYESEKNKILNFFKLLNLPRSVIDIDVKILLSGPEGTGKSELIKAIAKDQKIKIIELNLPLILSLKPSKQVESLNNLFHYFKYNDNFKPCVLLLNNFELINKIHNNPNFIPFIETLILEIKRIHLTKDKILIIAIFNTIVDLERRLINQFNEKIELKLPDQVSRALIIRKFLNETNLEMDLELDELSSKLAESEWTEGLTLRDLSEIFNFAKLRAFTEGRSLLSELDLEGAIHEIKDKKLMKVESNEVHEVQKQAISIEKLKDFEEELRNIKMLLAISTRMVKHALRLALTDNYNLINRLFSHFEATNRPFTIDEISQISGIKEEYVLKILKKMPYKMLFPKIGENYYVVFDKTTLEEILAEMALSI